MPNGIKFLDCEKEFTPLVASTTIKLSAEVFEAGGNTPTSIIHTDQAWYVIVNWEMTGHLVRHFCGDWYVSIVLESVGPGTDYQFPPKPLKVAMVPCGDGKYTARIDVAAGEVDARDEDGTLYIPGVTLGSADSCGKASHIYANCTADDEELHFVPGPPHT